MKAVEIVTIKNKLPLFKGEDEASKIELIQLEETGFELVAGKDLYSVGNKAVFIQPDYCLPDIKLFDSFIRPNGDESKSMLGKIEGKPARIRAKKFNFHKGDGNVVYSNGILLPYKEVSDYLELINLFTHPLEELDLTKELGITKYEEPEIVEGPKQSGGSEFPSGIYKTDENNINNLWGHIQFPIKLIGTEKIDGSSITIGFKDNEPFIGSRKLVKKLTKTIVVGYRKKTLLEKLMFWNHYDLKQYKTIENDDVFVVQSKPYIELLRNWRLDNFLLRGEINGKSMKGSGNKNNPANKEEINIKFFGIDGIENGIATKFNYENFTKWVNILKLPTPKEIFNKEFNSREEIEIECNNYFKNNMVEGIVLRTHDSKFSAKFMNLEYDSKK